MVMMLLLALANDADGWVEQLRSDAIEEREAAHHALKELGRAAMPALVAATRDSDPEVAGRARELLETIEIGGRLSPALRKAIPGVEDRLAAGGESAWAALVLEWAEEWDGAAAAPEVGRLLVHGSPPVREAAARLLGRWKVVSAVPALVRLSDDPEPEVRSAASDALCVLEHARGKDGFLKCLGGWRARSEAPGPTAVR